MRKTQTRSYLLYSTHQKDFCSNQFLACMHDTGTSGSPFFGRWVGMAHTLSVGLVPQQWRPLLSRVGRRRKTKNKNC